MHRVSEGTGSRDRAGAIKWAVLFSQNQIEREFGYKPPAALTPAPSLLRAMVMWLRYQRQQNADNTLRSYRSIVRKFWKCAKKRGVRTVSDLTREVLFAFRKACLAMGNSKVTIDNNLIALRSFMSWCVSKGWLASNPASQSRHGERLYFDEAPVRKDTYTRAEVDRIIAAAHGLAKHVFVSLASWGVRISELAMLEWSDIDFVGGWVKIRNKVTHDGRKYRPKDKTDRKFPLEGEHVHTALRALADLTGRSGYVLPLGRVKSRPDVAERRFINDLKEMSAAVGVPQERLTLHRFRHFFVSECADHGVPMATVMNWVGHDEMKMVMYYYSLRDDTAREAMRRLTTASPPAPAGTAPTPVEAAPAAAATDSPRPVVGTISRGQFRRRGHQLQRSKGRGAHRVARGGTT